ncbi:MAG: hypothetical protein ACPL88_05645, partial [Bryobacteraceae bacterium]
AQPQGCLASTSLGTLRLLVRPAQGGDYKPLESVNSIRETYRIRYEPVRLGAMRDKKAKVALALGCAGPDRAPARLEILSPAPAASAAEWQVPCRVSVLALVFGPQGLDAGKVRSLLTRDEELITQLAQYAEQTATIEALISALAEAELGAGTGKTVEAALAGFAQKTGAPVAKWDRNAPTEQQALALLRALNPALSAYDPLAAQPAARVERSAGLAAAVAGLFLGDAFGLAAGSAGLAYNLKTLLFPGTDFRSALAQQVPPDALRLCARRDPGKSRTRIAYVWAYRLLDGAPPALSLQGPAHLPRGLESALRVQSSDDWKLVNRLRGWKLASADGSWPVKVAAPSQGQLILDPGPTPLGAYRLVAEWDWDRVQVAGEVHLHDLGRLQQARLTPDSQDALAENNGVAQLTLEGADFQFVEKVELKDPASGATTPLQFRLPAGPRAGTQTRVSLEVDTGRLRAGDYRLVLVQSGGMTTELPVRIHPPHPRLVGLPLRIPLGKEPVRIELRGSGLSRIQEIRCAGASISLEAGTDGVRPGSLTLRETVRRGDRLALELVVRDLHKPLVTPDAIHIVGPAPRIRSVKLSLSEDAGVWLAPGELPARGWASATLEVADLEEPFGVKLSCQEESKRLRQEWLRPGAGRPEARVEQIAGGLFLMLEPGKFGQAGCTLTVIAENDAGGASPQHALGRIVRLPRIEQFTLTDQPAGESAYFGTLTGYDLETIEKTGWDETLGMPVPELP